MPKGTGQLGHRTKGDAALLRFAAAAEILESDFWIQYNELGGVQDTEVQGGFGNPVYTEKFENLDEDFPQYIHDNTDDEITHFTFLNAYLQSKGAEPVNLEQFRTLPGSTATGSSGQPRLTNLTQLTLDTSWWTRYRSDGTVLVTHETRLAQQALTKHPPQPQRIGRWKTEMTEPERLEFIRFAGDTLEELGYELEA